MRTPFKFGMAALTALAMVGLGSACSGDDDSSGPTAETQADEVEVDVSAEDGGTVEDEAGTLELDIPPGALADDTTITLETLAQEDDTEAPVYEFGPDGLEFEEPVTLSIEFDGNVPDGQRAALATYEGGKWVEIDGSTFENGVVSGEITHFSKFSIIFVEGVGVVLVSGCSEAVESFTACGGDPTGTWHYEEYCLLDQTLLSTDNPMEGTCSEATMEAEFIFDTEIVITDTTIQVMAGEWGQTSTLTIPSTCVSDMEMTCDEVETEWEYDSCAEDADACVCTATAADALEESEPQEYELDGNTLVTTNDDGTTETTEFCVQGDQMLAKGEDADMGGWVWILSRQ